MTNQEYIQSIVDAMAKGGIIPADTPITGTQIAEILEQVKTLGVTADADATAEDIAIGKTAYVNKQKLLGQVAEQNEVSMQLTTSSIVFKASKGIYRSDKFASLNVYRGQTNITPSDKIQTILTAEKYLKTNLTINAAEVLGPSYTINIYSRAVVPSNEEVQGIALGIGSLDAGRISCYYFTNNKNISMSGSLIYVMTTGQYSLLVRSSSKVTYEEFTVTAMDNSTTRGWLIRPTDFNASITFE